MPANVLFLPGLLCDETLWSSQIRSLADIVDGISLDLSPYDSIDAMAQGILDRAPDQFSLVGFSLGGCVALEVIARAPSRVTRLALLDTIASRLLPSVRTHYESWIPRIESGGLKDYLVDAFPRYVASARVADTQLRHAFVEMGMRLGPQVAVRQMHALLAYSGFPGDLSTIRCPTIVVCGDEDHRAPPAIHRELASCIPDAQFHTIAGSGHFTPLEQPFAVIALLRSWLTFGGAPSNCVVHSP